MRTFDPRCTGQIETYRFSQWCIFQSGEVVKVDGLIPAVIRFQEDKRGFDINFPTVMSQSSGTAQHGLTVRIDLSQGNAVFKFRQK